MPTRKDLIAGSIVMALIVVACLVENWRDRRKGDEAGPLVRTWLAILLAAAIMLFAVIGARRAHAHDYARPELNSWYMGLKSQGGGLCCDGSEATHLADVDWESRDGHYRVRVPDVDGKPVWVDVPDDRVIDQPNRDGRTLVWTFFQDGKPVVRCFLPGAMI